jgi:sodium transport system permease protein
LGYLSHSPLTYLISIILTQLLIILTPLLIYTTLRRLDFSATLRLNTVSYQVLLLSALVAASSFIILTALMSYFILPLFTNYEPIFKEIKGQMVSGASYNIYLLIFTVTALPALGEELLFRGFIFTGITYNLGKTSALIFSSLLFGLMHFLLPYVILMTLFGLILGLLLILTNSIIVPILVHFLYNALVIIALLNPDQSRLVISIPLLLPACFLFIFTLWALVRKHRLNPHYS